LSPLELLTFVRLVRETATFVSNVRQDGIRLQGGHSDIENNDITNANIGGVLNIAFGMLN